MVLLVGAAFLYASVRVGGHLSRQLSRPIEELIGWTGHIRRMEPLPPDRPRRGAPEFEALRTALREMADALEQGRAREIEAERLRAFRETARRVAHEMRNPLTPIRLAVAQLAALGGAGPAARPSTCSIAESGRLEQLAREFTEFGRLPEGPAAPVDLAELLTDIARTSVPPTMQRAAGARSRPSHAAGPLRSAAPRLRQHRPQRRRGLRWARRASSWRRWPRTAASGSRSAITGPACRAELAGRLFDPYVTAKSGGTGLGLALARQTVEMHQGAIAVEPTPGGGRHLRRADAGTVTGRSQVLLVDDEANIRRMLAALLREEGFTVAEASSGNAALLQLDDVDPDVVLLDLLMPPGPDGLETLASMRERGRSTPVIMMSGKAQLTDAVRAVKLGAFQFLEKPLTPESVLVTVRAALELNRTRAENRALHAELGRRSALVGESAAMRQVRALIARVGPTEARVLLTGESGTGKELAAAAVHGASRRAGRAVRHRQLRRHPAGPGGVRDVRPRARRVHRRHRAAAGPVRAGAHGHPLPRRDRRPERRRAGQAAAYARDRRAAAAGRRELAAGGRADRGGDQPPARGRGGRRRVPRGPVLPAQRVPHPAAAAAGAAGGSARARGAPGRAGAAAAGAGLHRAGRSRRSRATAGPATCASWPTWSSGSSS